MESMDSGVRGKALMRQVALLKQLSGSCLHLGGAGIVNLQALRVCGRKWGRRCVGAAGGGTLQVVQVVNAALQSKIWKQDNTTTTGFA